MAFGGGIRVRPAVNQHHAGCGRVGGRQPPGEQPFSVDGGDADFLVRQTEVRGAAALDAPRRPEAEMDGQQDDGDRRRGGQECTEKVVHE